MFKYISYESMKSVDNNKYFLISMNALRDIANVRLGQKMLNCTTAVFCYRPGIIYHINDRISINIIFITFNFHKCN